MNCNPNCDGFNNCSENHEVRRLPTGGGSAVIVCFNHYEKEIRYRKERNLVIAKENQFDTPDWETLEVYNGNS